MEARSGPARGRARIKKDARAPFGAQSAGVRQCWKRCAATSYLRQRGRAPDYQVSTISGDLAQHRKYGCLKRPKEPRDMMDTASCATA